MQFSRFLRVLPFLVLLLGGATPRARGQACSGVVCVRPVQSPDRVEFFALNGGADTVRVRFALMLENMQPDLREPVEVVLPPGANQFAFTLHPLDDRLPWNYSYRFRWQPEDAASVLASGRLAVLQEGLHPDSIFYEVRNVSAVPVGVGFARYRAGTAFGSADFDVFAGLAPGERRVLAAASRADAGWRSAFRVVPGCPGARADTAYVYRLPAASGASVEVLWHQAGETMFSLAPGTPVVAARAGTVAEVYTGTGAFVPSYHHNQRLGMEVEGQPVLRSNAPGRVLVVHEDGSVGLYAGLAGETLAVAVGSRVAVGTPLGTAARVWQRPVDAAAPLGPASGKIDVADAAALEARRGTPAPEGAPAWLAFEVFTLQEALRVLTVEQLHYALPDGVKIRKGLTVVVP